MLKQNDDFKCHMCHYSCKKQNIINQHMNTKHGAQQLSSNLKGNTSEKDKNTQITVQKSVTSVIKV